MKRSVFLVGFMGAGKSTIGELLAQQLGLEFVDLDREIELEAGSDIPTIFSKFGEARFRQWERALISRPRLKPVVMALGGGAFMSGESRICIRKMGTSIFLDWPWPVLRKRVAGDPGRPLAVLLGRMRQLYSARLAIYRCADLVWQPSPSNFPTPEEVVHDLIHRLARVKA